MTDGLKRLDSVLKNLEAQTAFLKENPSAFAALAGHTDNVGPEEYNLGLSLRRVESITDYLVNVFQVDKSQLIPFWFGQLNPDV